MILLAVLVGGCMLAGLQSRSVVVRRASPSQDAAATVAEPAQSFLSRALGAVGDGWRRAGGVFDSSRENERLRQQVERQQALADQAEEWRQESQRLRALLSLRDTLTGPSLSARAIGRGPSPWFDILTIDRGRSDGVQPGCAVVAGGGLVGQVYSVALSSSKVLCLTDRLGSVGGRVQSERARQVLGVCKGDGSGLLRLTYPDPDVDVRVGDAVVTSGHEHGSLFPPGLLIGHVVAAERRPHESAVVLVIRPAVDIDRVEEVLLLLPPQVRTAEADGEGSS